MQKKINIFTPTYNRFEKTKTALTSIIESVKNSKNDVYLHIGDNNSKKEPEIINWLKSLPSLNKNVFVYLSNKNIGKAAIINHMHKNTRDSDYFISIDSDMLADENDKYNWIDELVKIMEWEPAKNFGLLSTFQKGNNAHKLELQNEKTEFIGHWVLYGTFYGVAGGCVILKNKDFIDVGKYEIIDVYCGDDALLMNNVDKKLKKLVGITEDIRLTHMLNENYESEYQKWKIDKCHGKISFGEKGFWD